MWWSYSWHVSRTCVPITKQYNKNTRKGNMDMIIWITLKVDWLDPLIHSLYHVYIYLSQWVMTKFPVNSFFNLTSLPFFFLSFYISFFLSSPKDNYDLLILPGLIFLFRLCMYLYGWAAVCICMDEPPYTLNSTPRQCLMFVYLSIYVCIYLSVYLSVCLSLEQTNE